MVDKMNLIEQELNNIIAACKGEIIFEERKHASANVISFAESPLNTLETMIPNYKAYQFDGAVVDENPNKQDKQKFEITIYLSAYTIDGDRVDRDILLKVCNVKGWDEYQQERKDLYEKLK